MTAPTADHAARLAGDLGIPLARVAATAALLASGATVPFVARYRKEATGSLDEVAIAAIRDGLARLAALDARRDSIVGSLAERGLLTDDLRGRVFAAGTLALLEDIYLPFRPKRRTRAQAAREKGLEPLAARLRVERPGDDPRGLAVAFVDAKNGLESSDDALAGARDIIAEQASEDPDARAELRQLCISSATIRSRAVAGKETDGAKFKDYFDWQEPAGQAPSHRVLAMRRGEAEGFLFVRIAPPEDDALARMERRFVKGRGRSSDEVRAAVHDSWKRLLGPQLETEMRLRCKERADLE
ncbi:MAG: Tex-like N-terminal domain-containing protein, partial [Polyangiaceae bacterium]